MYTPLAKIISDQLTLRINSLNLKVYGDIWRNTEFIPVFPETSIITPHPGLADYEWEILLVFAATMEVHLRTDDPFIDTLPILLALKQNPLVLKESENPNNYVEGDIVYDFTAKCMGYHLTNSQDSFFPVLDFKIGDGGQYAYVLKRTAFSQ